MASRRAQVGSDLPDWRTVGNHEVPGVTPPDFVQHLAHCDDFPDAGCRRSEGIEGIGKWSQPGELRDANLKSQILVQGGGALYLKSRQAGADFMGVGAQLFDTQMVG